MDRINRRLECAFAFRIIARGARGGKGADGMGISKGATSIAVVELSKNQDLYILVGQEGGDACRKVCNHLKGNVVLTSRVIFLRQIMFRLSKNTTGHANANSTSERAALLENYTTYVCSTAVEAAAADHLFLQLSTDFSRDPKSM